MNLEEMARQFRAAFRVQNHPSKRSLQISLIDEEYAEFREAARHWPVSYTHLTLPTIYSV